MNMVESIIKKYLTAKQACIDKGFAREIKWQDSRDLNRLTETQFLCELAYVILNSGMKNKVIRGLFPKFKKAFLDFKSAALILEKRTECVTNALEVFGNNQKVNAIVSACEKIEQSGFEQIKQQIIEGGTDYLRTFDYIGPVIVFHLAKNIGLDVVKPDRHLVRIAQSAGFNDPHQLCSKIAAETGDKLCVIDYVLWRYATINHNYEQFFKN